MKVKITKIGESKNPNFRAADWKQFEAGKDNPGVSLPVDYTIEGYILGEIKEGYPLTVARTKRNDVEINGTFISSKLKDISGDLIKGYLVSTENSLYRIEILEKSEKLT